MSLKNLEKNSKGIHIINGKFTTTHPLHHAAKHVENAIEELQIYLIVEEQKRRR